MPVRSIARALSLVLSVVMCSALGGCLGPEVAATAGGTVAQTGATAFIGGELHKAYKLPMEQVAEAARAAIESLKLRPGVDRINEHSIYLMAREENGREISMRLEPVSPVVTRLKIRVGVWGDQSVSDLVLHEIEARIESLQTLTHLS